MIKDLTVGTPRKVLLQYSLPLFGSILFQQMYNVADSFVAGRYINTKALSAVGNSYELTLLYIAVAFGCNIGVSIMIARYFGEKDYSRVRTGITTALISCTTLALLLMILGLTFATPLLKMIRTPEDIFADSLQYLNIYILGFIFVLLYNISTGIFSALGDSRTPFIFLAISSISNVFADILFVKEFHMGVAGVAWATFLCQGTSAVFSFFVVLRRIQQLPPVPAPLFDRKVLKDLCAVAIPSIFQQSFISVGNIIIQGIINGFGISAIGGYAAAVKLNNMTISSLSAMANGMSNYCAQNAGAKESKRITKGFFSGLGLTWILACLFTLIFLSCGKSLVGLFITDGDREALKIGTQFLYILAPFYCVIATKLISDGVFRGIRQMKLFVISTFTDLFLRVVLSFIFSSLWGVTGIWCSWPVGWSIAALISFIMYLVLKRKNYGIHS